MLDTLQDIFNTSVPLLVWEVFHGVSRVSEVKEL